MNLLELSNKIPPLCSLCSLEYSTSPPTPLRGRLAFVFILSFLGFGWWAALVGNSQQPSTYTYCYSIVRGGELKEFCAIAFVSTNVSTVIYISRLTSTIVYK